MLIKKTSLVIINLGLILLTNPSWSAEKVKTKLLKAQPSVGSASSSSSVVAKKEAKSKLIESPLSGIVDYSYRTDLNSQDEKRLSQQKLTSGLSYELNNSFSFDSEIDLSWRAEGSNIPKENDNPSWGDLSLGANYSKELSSNNKIILSVSEGVPTGNESRKEGVKSTVTTGAALSTSFFSNKMTLKNYIGYSRIFQTYDISPNYNTSNPDSLTIAQSSLAFNVYKGFSIGASYSLWSVHFINGENSLVRNQFSQFISYKYKNYSGKLSYISGNYDKNDGYKFFFIDDTKRFVSLGASIEF